MGGELLLFFLFFFLESEEEALLLLLLLLLFFTTEGTAVGLPSDIDGGGELESILVTFDDEPSAVLSIVVSSPSLVLLVTLTVSLEILGLLMTDNSFIFLVTTAELLFLVMLLVVDDASVAGVVDRMGIFSTATAPTGG